MANKITAITAGDTTGVIALPYAVCNTDAGTAAKTATILNNAPFSLEVGAMVVVKFTNPNSAATPTLNINNTGAKRLYIYNNNSAGANQNINGWRSGAVQLFTYDGINWVRDFWENTTYTNSSFGQGYGTCSTAAATAAKVVSFSYYSLTTGGIISVKFTNAVPTNATMNVNSQGAKNIYYRGAKIVANVIKAGDLATFMYDGTQYQLLSIDRWQADIASLNSQMNGKLNTNGWNDYNNDGWEYETNSVSHSFVTPYFMEVTDTDGYFDAKLQYDGLYLSKPDFQATLDSKYLHFNKDDGSSYLAGDALHFRWNGPAGGNFNVAYCRLGIQQWSDDSTDIYSHTLSFPEKKSGTLAVIQNPDTDTAFIQVGTVESGAVFTNYGAAGIRCVWHDDVEAYINVLAFPRLKTNATILTTAQVDSALSSTSTNPVQNTIVNQALAGKLSSNGWSTYTDGETHTLESIEYCGLTMSADWEDSSSCSYGIQDGDDFTAYGMFLIRHTYGVGDGTYVTNVYNFPHSDVNGTYTLLTSGSLGNWTFDNCKLQCDDTEERDQLSTEILIGNVHGTSGYYLNHIKPSGITIQEHEYCHWTYAGGEIRYGTAGTPVGECDHVITLPQEDGTIMLDSNFSWNNSTKTLTITT